MKLVSKSVPVFTNTMYNWLCASLDRLNIHIRIIINNQVHSLTYCYFSLAKNPWILILINHWSVIEKKKKLYVLFFLLTVIFIQVSRHMIVVFVCVLFTASRNKWKCQKVKYLFDKWVSGINIFCPVDFLNIDLILVNVLNMVHK